MCEITERAELSLPLSTASPRAARAFARVSGCTEHAAQVLDDALLLISEIVTNAVLHGKPPLVIALECQDGGLRVRVRDGSVAVPEPRSAHDADESGRGLTLLDRLSDAWGVETVADEHGNGKAVWFELHPQNAPAADDACLLPDPL